MHHWLSGVSFVRSLRSLPNGCAAPPIQRKFKKCLRRKSMQEPHVYPRGCTFNSPDEIAGKKITVMGLGLNGGGEACVRYLLKHGAIVTVTDMKTREQLLPTITSLEEDPELDKSRLTYVLGEHRIQDFAAADCVIKNPAVKFEGNKFLAAAQAVETDISLFLSFTKAPIIAVTGSKGKSSTVSAIHYGLTECGFKAFLGGNITVSPLTFLEETSEDTPVVLELSSWQLRDLRGRKILKPHIAIITKIVPDHQNFYGSMDAYVADKKLIFADQTAEDYTIIDADDDGYEHESEEAMAEFEHKYTSWGDMFASETKATVLRYSKHTLKEGMFGVYQQGNGGFEHLPELTGLGSKQDEQLIADLFVPGDHNRTNVLNAALTLRLMGITPMVIRQTLATWKGIPHRLERFFDWSFSSENKKHKIIFYNDSAATVPEAAAAASQSFGTDIILITGGTDKELNFVPLARTLHGECGTQFIPKGIYLLSGTGTDKLTVLLDEYKVEYTGPFDSLEVLLTVLKEDLEGMEDLPTILPVVFSPGATSFGMFQNEFDRGNKFKEAVQKIFG